MATMLVSWKFDDYLSDALHCPPPAIRTQTEQPTPHALRFGYLTALCFALGRRGFASMLVHPGAGEAVLWVPFPRRPGTGLAVGAVESGGCWMFAYGSHSSSVENVTETAVRVIAVVTA